MLPPDAPKVVQVPVKRYDIEFSWDDILTPLTQLNTQPHVALAVTSAPESSQHVQQLSLLAQQFKDVVRKINEINPTVLTPTAGNQPRDTNRPNR